MEDSTIRIISDFKDYYDCMQAHGQDMTEVYMRRPECVEYDRPVPHWSKSSPGNFWPFPTIKNTYSDRNRKFSLVEHIVGFCGKIYPVLHLRKNVTDDWTPCNDLDDVIAFIDTCDFSKKEMEEFNGENKKKRYNYWRTSYHGTKKEGFKEFFAECAAKQDQFEEIFREGNAPIFVATYRDRYWYDVNRQPQYKPSTITFNAELKEHAFYRVVPVHLAYQEIQMYLSGILGLGNPPVPEVSNDDLVEAKGFNLKTSFRKEKQKPK